MPNIIELNLLENKSIVATMQGIPLANENSYKIIAGEENATRFIIKSLPNQYANATLTVEMVNSQGLGISETEIINNRFTLPVGMAVAGYGYISIKAYEGDSKVVFQPLKLKVWNTIPEWKDNVTKETNVRIENGYLILTENGNEYNLGYVKGEAGKDGEVSTEQMREYVANYASEYIPKVASRNLANLTFENAKMSSSNGVFSPTTTGRDYASSPTYIPVESGGTYTISWKQHDVESSLTVFEYGDGLEAEYNSYADPQYTSIKWEKSKTFTFRDTTKFIRLRFYASTDDWASLVPQDLQVEKGDTATAYIAPLVIDPKIIDFPTNEQKAEDLTETLPSYVISEANDVIDRVVSSQGGRTFTFGAITDFHYTQGYYTDGVDHACKALKYIDKHIKLDAVAVLGDYTNGYTETDYADAMADFRKINTMLDELRFAPNFRMQGNHDCYKGHNSQVHRHIQAYSDDVVWGSISGGYFHKDFEGYKLRVICVNTCETAETENALINCSTEQYQWLASVLDLSAKEDAADWQILILSHHPADFWHESDSSYSLANILNAYHEGTSFTSNYISCDFTGKNAAKLIGQIHAHVHNLKVDNLHLQGNAANSAISDVVRIATPNAGFGRENQYDIWQEETTYSKTANTADETAFVIYCIDLDASTIKAICYGAGYDREIDF